MWMKFQRSRAGRWAGVEQLECRRLLTAAVFDSPITPRLQSASLEQPLSSMAATLSDADIGAPAQAGSMSFSNGTYTISGGGSDIGGVSDQFNFASASFSGDGSMVARITSLSNTNPSAKAGIMFRTSASPTAAFAGIFLTPSSGIMLIARATDGGTAGQTTTLGPNIPAYLKLSRSGNSISGYYSSTGVTWTQVGSSQLIGFGSAALAGLAVTSRNPASLATATITGASLLLAPGWDANDVGSPVLPGLTRFDPSGNSYELSAGGTGIDGTADQFHFVSRKLTGDGSVAARIEPLAAPSAMAGLMIRSDLTAGSVFAAVAMAAGHTISFQWRAAAGGASQRATVAGVDAPIWLKLSREEDSFSASWSLDGSDWTAVAPKQTIVMPSAMALVGLAAHSQDDSTYVQAEYTSVSVTPGQWSNRDIGSAALAGSAAYDGPSNTLTIVGGGADIGGASDQFNFVSDDFHGDGTVVAYINSISGTDPSAKAGLMIRLDETPGAQFAGVFVSAQSGIVFDWRTTANASAQQEVASPPGDAVSTPVSLKLTRSGDSFTAFYSTDGASWILVGLSQVVSMGTDTLAGAALTAHDNAALCTASFTGLSAGKDLPPGAGIYSAADELFLNDLENRQVQFFFNETNPATGLVPDSASANGGSPSAFSSIAALGFGLTALTIGDQRGWLSHDQAYQRALTTVNFLYNTAAQVNGFYYHFLNPATGQRFGSTELSSVDTAELMAGVLNVAQYWAGTPLQTTALNIFNRVNWGWMQKPNGQFYGQWTPERGFEFGYGDFSEAALLYLLALGSPTHPVSRASWLSWSRTPVVNYSGFNFVTAQTGALFTVQYPLAWFDLRGLADSTGLNYYQNAQTATLAQRQMCINLSVTYPDYGPDLWGITASDSASGYKVWGGPPPTSNIDGTVVPTAPGGSLAFVPRQSIDALEFMQQTYGSTAYKKYGLVDAFNPLTGWTSSLVLGIDVGMMLVAAENSRSNFVWDTFMQSAVARQSAASAFPSLTPDLLAAASRKIRTDSVVDDLPVELNDSSTVENRQGGPTQIVLNFESNVVKGANFAVSLSSGNITSTSVSGSTLTLNLSGATDAQTLVVDVDDVRHFATAASGHYTFSLGVLLSDTNQDRSVDTIDFNNLASNFAQSGKNSSQGDFNDDGSVDTVDFNLLTGQFGKSISASAALATSERTFTAAAPLVRSGFSDARIVEEDLAVLI
jgi:hypothetical protein